MGDGSGGFKWSKVWEKGAKQFIYAGAGAALPLVVNEMTRAEGISGVQWVALVDKTVLVFLVASLGGAVGAVDNWRKHRGATSS